MPAKKPYSTNRIEIKGTKIYTCQACGMSILTKAHNRKWCQFCGKEKITEAGQKRKDKTRQRKRWTEKEVAYLKAHYRKLDAEEIAEVLGVTKKQVMDKAYTLHLTKKRKTPKHLLTTDRKIELINRLLKQRGIKGCQFCGESRWLDIHHIDKNPENDADDNLAIVCPNHHASFHRTPWKWIKCEGCGKEFIVSEYWVNRRIYRFCSIECRNSKVEKFCKECGKVFKVGRRNKKDQNRLYCSKPCQARAIGRKRVANAT